MTQVTQEYLDGILEGRAYLRRWEPTLADMRDVLANVVQTAKGFEASSPCGQMLRGERDFWRGQIKRAEKGVGA